MKKSKYKLICGLEIHVELATNSKMFCGCKNDPFEALEPNCYTCPTCLGMPGALPVPNRRAIEWTVKLGLVTNSKVNLFSKFDRKHYNYPDLPKGYQISQYDLPFCYQGKITTSEGDVTITRIHLEEDTGKLLHKTINGQKVSLVDFNRSGVPLVEIVSEPEITSAKQAAEYGRKLRQLVRYLGFSQANMERGEMRLEANISLSLNGSLPNYKVEVKNINSFRYLEQAIEYEIKRQAKLLDQGITPKQETRGWDHIKGETFPQRSKETAEDYRYFPDPDIPPIVLTEDQVKAWKKELPTLPDIVAKRWQERFDLPESVINQLLTTNDKVAKLNRFFGKAQKAGLNVKKVAHAIVNKKFDLDYQMPCSKIIAKWQEEMATEVVDNQVIDTLVKDLVQTHPEEVKRYQAGEKRLLGFFLGQLRPKLPPKADMRLVKETLEDLLQS